MKIKRILCVALCVCLFIIAAVKVNGAHQLIVDERDPFEQPILIRATCYTSEEGAITSSGKPVRENTIAGKREWQGCIAFLYTYSYEGGQPQIKELIGVYEVIDTGAGIDTDGDGKGDSIIKGSSIDVYQPTLHQAEEWTDIYGDYVMMMLVRGKG